MAGNSALRETLHRHFGDRMKYSGIVGLTHRRSSPGEGRNSGRQAAIFFAPTTSASAPRSGVRAASTARFGAAWAGFAPKLDHWVKVSESRGRGR